MLIWGLVKRFDTRKGFGFVVAEDDKGDILLHARQLRAFGVASVAEGARILVRVETTARGRRVAEVCDIRPPNMKEPPPAAGPLEPACVKWFDRAMGYGFVNVFGRREDVYLHMATLRECGFGAVEERTAIVVRVTAGRDGPTVCEVRDWDYPNRPRGRRRTSHRHITSPAVHSGRVTPDDLTRQAAAAILGILRSGANSGLSHWPRATPRVRAALRDAGVEGLFDHRDHTRHVDTILARVFGEP